ncbi:unnamed protein product [Polarella glacialis]|nr:unnamed protein product [Polarella glacialis]
MIFVQVLQWRQENSWRKALFYTVWNYHWQILFWACATTASASTILHGTAELPGTARIEYLSPRFRTVLGILFEVSLPMTFFVSIVLWGVLAPVAAENGKGWQVFTFYSYNQHALNTLCTLVEFCINRLLIVRHHMILVLVWSSIYCVFSWIQHAFTDFWPYFFLQLNFAALFWYALLLLLHVALFSAAVCASDWKRRKIGLAMGSHCDCDILRERSDIHSES